MFFWMDSSTIWSLQVSPGNSTNQQASVTCLKTQQELICPVHASICRILFLLGVRTFSSGEHGGGQLTLLALYVAQREPAGVAVRHHRHDVVRSRQVSRGRRGLQNGQPAETEDGEVALQ